MARTKDRFVDALHRGSKGRYLCRMPFGPPRPPTPRPPSIPGLLQSGLGLLPSEQLGSELLLEANAAMWAVVLAGGIGSRFWPLSSPERPKQLLRLVGERPLIADGVARLQPLVPSERVLVLTSADIADAIRAAIPHVPEYNMLVEPEPLGTAAAVARGTAEITRRAGPDSLIVAMHADLAIAFPDAFRHTLRLAGGVAARDDVIATIGVRPTRVEPGFGHLELGDSWRLDYPSSSGGPAVVERFVEKPPPEEAARLMAAGALWHAGVAVWRARVLTAALRTAAPEVADALDLLAAGDTTRYATMVRPISIERGLFERSANLVAVPGDFGWDDVGTWASLRRARELDDDGNGVGGGGAVHFVDASGNIVHAEGASAVALYGVDGLLVVSVDGTTFVTTVERAADLKALLDDLPADVRARP
jgi:mannose-1-phosphate guanylyltransferase